MVCRKAGPKGRHKNVGVCLQVGNHYQQAQVSPEEGKASRYKAGRSHPVPAFLMVSKVSPSPPQGRQVQQGIRLEGPLGTKAAAISPILPCSKVFACHAWQQAGREVLPSVR